VLIGIEKRRIGKTAKHVKHITPITALVHRQCKRFDAGEEMPIERKSMLHKLLFIREIFY
jgi:hypothetical protein